MKNLLKVNYLLAILGFVSAAFSCALVFIFLLKSMVKGVWEVPGVFEISFGLLVGFIVLVITVLATIVDTDR